MNDNVSQLSTRDEIDEDLLIVDYVAERLDAQTKAAFETRLRDDEELAARVAEEREFRSSIVGSAQEEIPEAAAFDQLRNSLEDEPVKRASPWRLSAVAAVMLAAVAALVFMDAPAPDDGEFVTLSSEDTVPVAESRQIRLVFAADLDDAGRLGAADELGFSIIAGPGENGAYVVESGRAMTRDELLQWRDDPRIDLAEPIRYGPQQ